MTQVREPEALDQVFEALASEHRRHIVGRLAAGPVETPALGAHFDMSKQALQRHLQLLEGAGLIERELNGRVHTVRLRPEPLDGVASWTREIRTGWETSLDQLADHLEET